MSRFRAYAWLLLAANLLVILWGAWVRVSGSGAGCGEHWPLCNGQVLPRDPAVETVIELTHRVTSGLVLLMTVVQVAWARRVAPAGSLVRRGAWACMGFMVAEAGVGALLVLQGLVAKDDSVARAIVMAIHLVNTFLLIGAYTVTALWAGGKSAPRIGRQPLLALGLGLALLALMALGVSGAITALGDTLFPAASLAEGVAQDLSPTAHFLIRLRVLHPLGALGTGLFVLLAALFVAVHRPHCRRAALIFGLLYLTQIGVGFTNLALLVPASLQITHLLVADLVWISLVRLSLTALADPPPAPALLAGSP